MQIHNSLRAAVAVATLTLATGLHASVFYKFEVVAETGLPNGPLQFNRSVSINDNGQLAFIAQEPLDANNKDPGAFVYIAEHVEPPGVGFESRRVADWHACNTLSRIGAPQMNNAGKIVVTFLGCDMSYPAIYVLDSNQPKESLKSFIPVAGMNTIQGQSPIELGYFPTINNNQIHEVRALWGFPAPLDGGNNDGVCNSGETCIEQIAYTLETGPNAAHPNVHDYLSTLSQTPILKELDLGSSNDLPLTINARPRIADTGEVVVRDGNLATDPIVLYDYQLAAASSKEIAGPSNGFTSLGSAPNISADGKIVVFIGDRGQGMGVFASVDDGSPERKLIRVAGENNTPGHELGYGVTTDTNGVDHAKSLYFSAFRQNYRIAVTHLARGGSGMIGDSFVVGFMATPSGASKLNPNSFNPYTFSNQEGIWTVRVDIDKPLNGYCITPGTNGALDSSPAVGEILTPNQDSGRTSGRINVIKSPGNSLCLSSPKGDDESNYHIQMPIPVVQIGDTLSDANGQRYPIDTLATHDTLAAASTDNTGASRIERRGDHRVAFYAASGTKQFVVMASHLDSDQDGLLDHWEQEGIDADQDGVIDLDLSAMGADVCKRDLFLEIDWLRDKEVSPLNLNRGHTNKPHPGVTQFLVDMFKQAPAPDGENQALLCAIPAGINLHIDAGSSLDLAGNPYSKNMPFLGPYGGGETIYNLQTGNNLDLIYRGLSNSVNIPGLKAESFETIKDLYFRTTNNGAREFAFHYTVLADYDSLLPSNSNPYVGEINRLTLTAAVFFDLNIPFKDCNPGDQRDSCIEGNDIMLISGAGAGQVRKIENFTEVISTIEVTPNWVINPAVGDKYVIFSESLGHGQVDYREDFSSVPGSDIVISLAGLGATGHYGYLGELIDQSHTLAHELGHNLGLRHGGNDHENGKEFHISLMNYLYAFCKQGDRANCPVTSYSGIDALQVFDEWKNLKMDFRPVDLASSAMLFASGEPIIQQDEISYTDRVDAAGLPDLEEPTILIDTPVDHTTIALGSSLKVRANVTDNIGMGDVLLSLDTDGNGEIDPNTETLNAMLLTADTYEGSFPNITGPTGARSIKVQARDVSGLINMAHRNIRVIDRLQGDLDDDGDIDQADINLVLAKRGTQASGAGDPRDLDGDGQITSLDARKLVTLCTRARCATN